MLVLEGELVLEEQEGGYAEAAISIGKRQLEDAIRGFFGLTLHSAIIELGRVRLTLEVFDERGANEQT